MKIRVCTWKACSNKFSNYILDRLKNDKQRFNLENLIIEETECVWDCTKWPNIIVDWNLKNYVNPAKASELLFNNKKKK